MQLRKFLYLDSDILNDYLSAIEGYTYDEETRTESSSTQNSMGGGLGISIISAKGDHEKIISREVRKDVKISDAAKFDKMYQYLNKENDVKYYEYLTNEIFAEISKDDLLEISVTPRFSKMKTFLNAAETLVEIADIFQSINSGFILNEAEVKNIKNTAALTKSINDNQLSCVFSFEDNIYPVVAYLNKTFLKVQQNSFVGQVTLLCKVQRKIEKGISIELDEIFEPFKNLPLNREQKRKISKNMNNPDVIKDVIKGPALKVLPVAIYQ